MTSLFISRLHVHCVTTPCYGDRKHCRYVRFYITIVNRQRVSGLFCSSKRASRQAWQNSSYFITFTLHNVYLQHGGGNTDSTCNDDIVILSIGLHDAWRYSSPEHNRKTFRQQLSEIAVTCRSISLSRILHISCASSAFLNARVRLASLSLKYSACLLYTSPSPRD